MGLHSCESRDLTDPSLELKEKPLSAHDGILLRRYSGTIHRSWALRVDFVYIRGSAGQNSAAARLYVL